MRLPQELLACVAAFALGRVTGVRANTEIVNFAVPPRPDAVVLPETSTWSEELILHDANKLVRVQPAPVNTPIATVCEPVTAASLGRCPHELWLMLGVDDSVSSSYSRFTLRVSWPASRPADFYIDTYTPAALAELVYGDLASEYISPPAAGTRRRMFARIRIVSAGVLSPAAVKQNATLQPVTFIVTLEPLLFGVLPGSVIPTFLCLLVIGGAAGLLVFPRVSRYLQSVADQIRFETAAEGSRKDR